MKTGQRIKRWLLGILLLLAVAGCSHWLFGATYQRQQMFPRHFIDTPTARPAADAGIQTVWHPIDGGEVESWYLAPTTGPAPALIYAHGNGELIDHNLQLAQALNAKGLAVLLPEYPGYGRSGGSPSQASITAALVRSYDWLIEQPDVDPERIVLYGYSLGGAAIAQLAARRPSAALVLQSTVTSFRDFISTQYWLPGFAVADSFDTAVVLDNYEQPVLILHGRSDSLFDPTYAERLAKHAASSRVITFDCGHNNCPADRRVLLNTLVGFLVEAGILDSTDAKR